MSEGSSTKRWIVSVHNGGGSMAEAATPVLAFILGDAADAEHLERRINTRIEASPNSYIRDEWWAEAYPEDEIAGLGHAFSQAEARIKEEE